MKNFEKFKTAEERAHAYDRFCEARFDKVACCAKCELQMTHLNARTGSVCPIAWLNLEAEKEEILPCPYCGSECRAVDGSKIAPDKHGVRPYSYVKCELCGYTSTVTDDYDKSGIGDIIAKHNRVARAVMKEKKGAEDEEVNH